jgi:hypothetical protein
MYTYLPFTQGHLNPLKKWFLLLFLTLTFSFIVVDTLSPGMPEIVDSHDTLYPSPRLIVAPKILVPTTPFLAS